MIENQVVSQKLSEEINNLGITIPSIFYWTLHRTWKNVDEKLIEADSIYTIQQWGQITEGKHFSAYLIGEIGSMLTPENLKLNDIPESFFPNNNVKFFQNLYSANFWAELLIHLIEHDKINIEEINKTQ